MTLREQLERIEKLSVELNRRCDDMNDAVKRLETFLRETCGRRAAFEGGLLRFSDGRISSGGVLWDNLTRDAKIECVADMGLLLEAAVDHQAEVVATAGDVKTTLEGLQSLFDTKPVRRRS